MPTLFFSYSHADESLRDQLEIHLSALQRQGTISTWHDRRITVGTELGTAIDEHIDTADVTLLLVSPNFIASDYCYEREMNRALQRHSSGGARVIPVILRPCDWHDLPFGKLAAAPTDGKPITKWSNIDEAFLDVVTSIKAAMRELGQPAIGKTRTYPPEAKEQTTGIQLRDQIRTSNLRIRKTFSDLDKDTFRHEGFEYIAKFFENSMQELANRNPNIERRFRRIDANRFSAALYRDSEKVCKGSVCVGGESIGNEGIEYSMTDEPQHHGMNEAVYVKNDGQSMYFEPLGMQSYGARREKLTCEGTAELFWAIFVRPLQD
jgi:hypothetical protein